MSFSQRQQLTEPFKIATMRQRGYLLEIAPSFQSWFICFFDDRWRQSGLNQATIERNARDFDWSLDLLRRGHSPANQWAALGPFQGLRKLYHYYRGTSVGMQYIDDEQIYKHLAAALARGQMEVHKVYDPHEAYRAFAAAAASSGASSNAASDDSASDDSASESKPETRRVGAGSASVVPATASPSSEPESLDECEHRLALARERLDKEGYKPRFTDEQQLANVNNGSVTNARYLVSFQPVPKTGDKLAFQRDSKLVPIWATSFEQLENADTDPALIADILATGYDPNQEYVLHIIDRGPSREEFGKTTVVPTWDKTKALAPLHVKAHDPKTLSAVMDDSYKDEYAGHIQSFKDAGASEFDQEAISEYSENLTDADREKFLARHAVRTEIGANSEFTGDGLTKSREGQTRYGVVETLTLEKNPPAIVDMKNVKTIKLKPRG